MEARIETHDGRTIVRDMGDPGPHDRCATCREPLADPQCGCVEGPFHLWVIKADDKRNPTRVPETAAA